jgi:hypothetical protein
MPKPIEREPGVGGVAERNKDVFHDAVMGDSDASDAVAVIGTGVFERYPLAVEEVAVAVAVVTEASAVAGAERLIATIRSGFDQTVTEKTAACCCTPGLPQETKERKKTNNHHDETTAESR